MNFQNYGLQLQLVNMKEYETYLFDFHCEGDIFNSMYRPYTYEEWIENNKPINGGVKL